MVACPICGNTVKEININSHIDSDCKRFIDDPTVLGTQLTPTPNLPRTNSPTLPSSTQPSAGIEANDAFTRFLTPLAKRSTSFGLRGDLSAQRNGSSASTSNGLPPSTAPQLSATPSSGQGKRQHEDIDEPSDAPKHPIGAPPVLKRAKNAHAPLAERMRPQSLDDVAGQELVGPDGVLRNLIVTERVPSMILWGGPGTGKTTIARLIAQTAGSRFVEINSTSSGVAECKRLFAEAKNELGLTGRKTIIFCDEIHRFSKSQQDVFLGPVEAGQVTLIGATTENPSFKVVNALLSRCRTFTLSKLSDTDVYNILRRALIREVPSLSCSSPTSSASGTLDDKSNVITESTTDSFHTLANDNFALIRYLAAFADGDARTGLNLVELALDLCQRPGVTDEDIKKSLTQTLVYDRAGDQHYDTISAFHKSVRGSNADAALYYLARMLQSGEDPLYIARRMVVMASEDIGLADNTMLPLATAAYSAAEKIGMPECRINLAHCAVALCLAPKSVKAYRGLNAAFAALSEPGVAGLPVPVHLRNAPTKLMKELGYGATYKYNPDYLDGVVEQDYLPGKLAGRRFLGGNDLGDKTDPDIAKREDQSSISEPVGQGELLLNPDGD